MRAVLPRLVLAFVLAVPPFLGLLAASLEAEQVFTLRVRMTSSTSGMLQVFPDIGSGYRDDLASTTVTAASTSAHEYHLPLKPGTYNSLRIDPGLTPGTYVIESVTIADPQGQLYATIPLAELTAAYHLTVLERTAERVVFDCPPNGYDPQILYTPSGPLRLLPEIRTLSVLVRWFTLYLAIGFVLLWVAQLALGRFAPIVSQGFEAMARGGAAHPQITIVAAALVATVIAMYPLLFFGRSLVSPNNGGVLLLHDRPPFHPGSSDREIEDTRGVDVGAMMWAFVPYSTMQRRALAAGEWPLWNRYAGPGLPLWGQGQTFLFDPLHWLTLIGPDPAPGWDLKFAAHRFVFASGIGVAAFVVLGAWVPAALVASTAPFAGFFAFRLNHPAAFAVTYAPWVLTGWFLLAQATTPRRRAAASIWLALASALVLFSSPPKEGVMMLLVMEAIGALALLLSARAGRHLLRQLSYAVAAGIATVLLTAPHWLVFLDTLRESVTQYDIPAAHFASPSILQAMALGPIFDGQPGPALHVLSTVLLVAALLSPVRLLRNPAMLACLLGAIGAIALACGVVPESWIVRVPLLANMHSFHTTFISVALVPLLMVSAAGAATLLDASRVRIVMITAGMVTVAWCVLGNIGGITALGRFQGWLVHGAMLGAVLVPITVFTVRRGFPRVLPVTATAVLAWLLMAAGGQHLETRIPALDKVLVQPRVRSYLEGTTPSIDAIRAQTEPSRVVGLGSSVLMTGSQALYGLEGVGGPDALFLGTREELAAAAPNVTREGWRFLFPPASLVGDAALLDLLNVRFVLANFNDAPNLGSLEPITQPDVVRAVRRPTAWPRAFFVDAVTTYPDVADLLRQVAAQGRPMAAVQASDAVARELTKDLPATGSAFVAADQYALTPNTTRFRVRAPGPGVAVLGESYLPNDFRVTVNDRPAAYFRVDHAFKAVVIPGTGDWDIRFEYRPEHWTIALTAASAGLLVVGALGLAAASRLRGPRVRAASTSSSEA